MKALEKQFLPFGWQGLIILVLVSSLGLLGLCTGCRGESTSEDAIVASGFIEGEEVTVASEVSGRVVEMYVDRGDSVRAGDVVLRLDDAVLQSQRGEAEAALAAAEAHRDLVVAGARAEEIAAARAALSQAESQLEGARQAVINARETISRPLGLDVQIAEARAQVQLAEQEAEMARANLAETELLHGVYAEQGGDVKRTWDLQLEAGRAALRQAEAKLQGAQDYLAALLAMRGKPLTMEAQLHAAEMQARIAEAQVDKARAALDQLLNGPTPEEIAVAEAQVRQAQAALGVLDAQVAQRTLTAPMDGIVTARSVQVGETATAGMPLLTIANLDEVTLVIYIPETKIGRVRIGQTVEVKVDSFPERVFTGRVVYIAGEAEFTPRNVQTQEERVNLVFAVKIRILNPDGLLKPGMPADASIEE